MSDSEILVAFLIGCFVSGICILTVVGGYRFNVYDEDVKTDGAEDNEKKAEENNMSEEYTDDPED